MRFVDFKNFICDRPFDARAISEKPLKVHGYFIFNDKDIPLV